MDSTWGLRRFISGESRISLRSAACTANIKLSSGVSGRESRRNFKSRPDTPLQIIILIFYIFLLTNLDYFINFLRNLRLFNFSITTNRSRVMDQSANNTEPSRRPRSNERPEHTSDGARSSRFPVWKRPLREDRCRVHRFGFPSTSEASFFGWPFVRVCKHFVETPLSSPRPLREIAFASGSPPLFVRLFSHESNRILIYTGDAHRDLS